MTTITLKSTAPDIAIPLLNNALEREKRMIRNSISRTQKRIEALSIALDVHPEAVLAGTVARHEGTDMDYIELEGEVELLRHLQDELRELESMELCA